MTKGKRKEKYEELTRDIEVLISNAINLRTLVNKMIAEGKEDDAKA